MEALKKNVFLSRSQGSLLYIHRLLSLFHACRHIVTYSFVLFPPTLVSRLGGPGCFHSNLGFVGGHEWASLGDYCSHTLSACEWRSSGNNHLGIEEDYPRFHDCRTSRRGVSLPNEALDHSTFSHRTAADSGLAS